MIRLFPAVRVLSAAALVAALSIAGLAACSPAEGSKEWCEDLKKKPKGDWTANEAGTFAKSCILQ